MLILLRRVIMFKRIKRSISLAGFSAGLMYFFDPDLGNRRRSLVRDQVHHFFNRAGQAIDATARDLQNRLYGMVCEFQHLFGTRDTSDDVVKARVQTKLGRYSSHPRSIEVAVHEGVVTLSGPILTDEAQDVVRGVEAVDGVRRVENQMSVHEGPGICPRCKAAVARGASRLGLCRRTGRRRRGSWPGRSVELQC
jgi:hypothetical protein